MSQYCVLQLTRYIGCNNHLIKIRDSNSLTQLSFKSKKIIEDSLRGGGCGPSIITEKEILDISTKKIKLPKEFFDQLKKNCYLLITHGQMSPNDQRSQTSILFALQWFHYNCEYIHQCCKKDNDVGLIYQIFLNYAEQILKEVPNYIRSNGFIAYRVLQVINELLRVVFSFQINNENHQFDEGKKIELIELTEIIRSELEIEQNEIWVTGVDYELKLIEIMIHNCNINYSGNGVIMTTFIKQLILSAVNSTIQDGLVESLIDAAEYVFNIPYEKIVYPKELYIQYFYFQALKYTIINEIQNNYSIQTQIEKLINLYKKYVQSSNNWIVHYSWITLICDLLSFRGIIFRDNILNTTTSQDGLQNWNFMVEKNFIKPFPQQKFGVIQLYTNYQYINFNNKQDIHEKIGGYNLFCDALMKEQLGDDNIQFWKKYTKFTFIEQTFQNSNLMIKSIGTEVLEASISVLQEKISSTNDQINVLQKLIPNFTNQKTEDDFQMYHNHLQATNFIIWNNTIQLLYILSEIYEKEKLISMQIKLLINLFKQKGKYNNQIYAITQNQSKFKESLKALMSEIYAYQFSCIKIEYLCSNLKFLNQRDFEKIEFDNLETIFNSFLEHLSSLLINDKTLRSMIYNDLLEENKNSIPQTKGIPQITAKHQDLIEDLKELFKVPIIDSYVQAIQFSLQPIQPAPQNLLLDVKLLIKYLQILINLFKILQGKIYFILQNFEITLFQEQTYVPNQNQEIDMATLKNLICNMLQNLRNIISVNYSLEINENLFQQRIKELSETLEQNTAIIASINDNQTTNEMKQAKTDTINIILELQNETLTFLISHKNDQNEYLKNLSEKIEEKLQVWKAGPAADQKANQKKQEASKNQKLKFLEEKIIKDLQGSEKQLQEKIKKLEQCFINFRIEQNAKKVSQNMQTPKAKEFYEILTKQIQHIIEEVNQIIQNSTPVFDYSQTIQQPLISKEQLQQFITQCFQKADYQEWNLDELYQEIEEDIYKSTNSTEVNQQSGSDHKVRECLVMNLLKIQESVSKEKILKFVQWQIKQMWILERNENVRSLLKNKDLLEMQRKLFSKDLKSFSSQIQDEMQDKLDQLQALEQQIRLEGNLDEQIRLQDQLKQAYQELDEYLQNITDMSTQMNISLIFLKEIAKELKSIKNKIDTLTENVNQIANDVRKLRGKTFQQLLVIRKEKVLDLASLNEMDSIYIPLKTIELISKTGQENDVSLLLVEQFSDPKSEESLVGELNEFLWGKEDQKRDVFLIRGQAGSGKSRSVKKIEEFLWKMYDYEPNWIPIYVSFPQIKNPKFNLFEQALDSEYYNFDSTQTKELKDAIRKKQVNIIFIFDSYDEMKSD